MIVTFLLVVLQKSPFQAENTSKFKKNLTVEMFKKEIESSLPQTQIF